MSISEQLRAIANQIYKILNSPDCGDVGDRLYSIYNEINTLADEHTGKVVILPEKSWKLFPERRGDV